MCIRDRVRVVDADHEEHEADRMVARIQSLRAGTATTSGGVQYRDFKEFAILYRANHKSIGHRHPLL